MNLNRPHSRSKRQLHNTAANSTYQLQVDNQRKSLALACRHNTTNPRVDSAYKICSTLKTGSNLRTR